MFINNTSFEMKVTMSKLLAFYMLTLAVVIDLAITKSAIAFMFAVPFVSALVLGKQKMDQKKGEKE